MLYFILSFIKYRYSQDICSKNKQKYMLYCILYYHSSSIGTHRTFVIVMILLLQKRDNKQTINQREINRDLIEPKHWCRAGGEWGGGE